MFNNELYTVMMCSTVFGRFVDKEQAVSYAKRLARRSKHEVRIYHYDHIWVIPINGEVICFCR